MAVTATYRRPQALATLLESLRSEREALVGVLIVDNASDVATADVSRRSPVSARVLVPGCNLGCGGGVAFGIREALRDPDITHVWLFDDDAQATPQALQLLLEAMARADAQAAVPLVTDDAGYIGWFPGRLAAPAWDVIRRGGMAPADFRRRCGVEPVRWDWAPWPSLLVTRRAVETVGLPRDDFWFQGEDLEWSLRLSARFTGVLAPAAECRHLPPPAEPKRVRLKHAAMLQNNAFTATRLRHGRRALRHLPGNAWRFLQSGRWSFQAWTLLVRAHWLGAIRGIPAGRAGGDAVRREWDALSASGPVTRI